MSKLKRFFGFLLLVLLVFGSIKNTKAVVDSCTAFVGPNSVNPGSSGPLFFTIENSSSVDIMWVKITSPNGNFTVTDGQKPAWTTSSDSSSVTYTGASLQAGATETDFIVSVVAAGSEAPAASFTVQVSDSADGSGAINCTGSTSVTIASGSPGVSTPEFGSVTVNASGTSAVLNFDTSQSARIVVYYGPTESLGSTKTDNSYTASHSITLSELTVSTTYYYYMFAVSESGLTAYSADLTFTTAGSDSTTSTTTTDASTVTGTSTKVDSESPKISLITDFSKPFKEVPIIKGKATDDTQVGLIEYSLDGGKNWINVKITKSSSVNFSFQPKNLEDDNYDLVVRATDSSNKTGTDTTILVIDKLPPAIGGNNIFLGPQNIFPSTDGTISTVKGSKITIAVNAVGGPTRVDMYLGVKKNPFHKIEGTNIWKGDINFDEEGEFNLTAISEDGAGNVTERQINPVHILPSGKITSPVGERVSAKVTLFVYSENLGNWSVWDGASFGQENPRVTENGEYGFLTPAGRYYLEIEAPGFRTSRSEIFESQTSSIVNSNVILNTRPTIKFLGYGFTLPRFLDFGETLTTFEIDLVSQEEVVADNSLTGNTIADIQIKMTDGSTLTRADLISKKKIVDLLLLTTWSPLAQEQLSVLNSINNDDFEVIPVFVMESESVAKSFLRRGSYGITAGVDSDGKLLKDFPITSIPQHFVLDRDGVIRYIYMGAKSQSELKEILVN